MIMIEFSDRMCECIDDYYELIKQLDLSKVKCGCGKTGALIKYGKYVRSIIIDDEFYDISIQRVYCKKCKKTHALIPSFMIPFVKETLDYILDLISYSKNIEINKADYELLKWFNVFKKWEGELKNKYNLETDDPIEIIEYSIKKYNMTFLQPKKRKIRRLYEANLYFYKLPT